MFSWDLNPIKEIISASDFVKWLKNDFINIRRPFWVFRSSCPCCVIVFGAYFFKRLWKNMPCLKKKSKALETYVLLDIDVVGEVFYSCCVIVFGAYFFKRLWTNMSRLNKKSQNVTERNETIRTRKETEQLYLVNFSNRFIFWSVFRIGQLLVIFLIIFF